MLIRSNNKSVKPFFKFSQKFLDGYDRDVFITDDLSTGGRLNNPYC